MEPGRIGVTVMLFGAYARYLPSAERGGPAQAGRASFELEDGCTAGGLADMLGLPPEARRYVTRNGERVDDDETLGDGDVIRFLVPLAGG
ncbi:MAG: MoaD/ThiS family protein [Thermoleophilia bacterium]|nr:MoaD/ThiS family protein [Thermoleophilia bacterium]